MPVIWRGPADRPQLALTIDDFPGSGLDQPGEGSMALLDLLRKLAIPVTFFAIGEQVERHPGMAALALADGHELGNHMWRDSWSFALPRQAFLRQLDATTAAIEADLAAAGASTHLRWFRPAGGWIHPAMVSWARTRGYRTVLGSIWPLDGLPLSPPGMLQRWAVRRLAHPGGILVLHDNDRASHATARTLAEVVPALQQGGFRFASLTQLLDADSSESPDPSSA